MLNTVTQSGRATIDVDLKYSQSGVAVATVIIAVDDPFSKGPDGKPETSFFKCKAFRKTAEIMAQYIKKGQKFGVSGRLKQERWETQDGQKRSEVIIMIDQVDLPPRTDGQQYPNQQNQQRQQGNNGGWAQQQNPPRPPAQNNDPFGGPPLDINDDDLPF